ncbi:MAG TPA: hypothetical protein VFW96_14455 [Thermomicrobiales bacterium]|nr:hypothetical protein [Thermomicrobiales bacterium]
MQWREHLAHKATARLYSLPMLAPPSATYGVYFTDEESLAGMAGPVEVARRVGLGRSAYNDCSEWGCAIVKFPVPDNGIQVPAPSRASGVPGLAAGGAREWVATTNIAFDAAMEVWYVDWDAAQGGRRFRVLL